MGFSFEMGDEEPGLMTTGSFLGEDEFPLWLWYQTDHYKLVYYTVTVQHGDLATMSLSWQIILVLQKRLVKV